MNARARRPGARRRAALMLGAAVLAGCATTTESRYVAVGDGVLCDPDAPSLGPLIVLPETAWRADQKDRPEREAMALRAIRDAFAELPCGAADAPVDVRPFAAWSAERVPELVASLARGGADTAVLVRVEELTPRFLLTLSLPFLWSASNEADFRVLAVRTEDGAVIEDFRVKRVRAGPFHLRPARWSEDELRRGLEASFGGAATDGDD